LIENQQSLSLDALPPHSERRMLDFRFDIGSNIRPREVLAEALLKDGPHAGMITLIDQWDELHGEIEAYNKRGKHLGALDAVTGDMIKDADPGRSIDV
jgi:Cytotoxic